MYIRTHVHTSIHTNIHTYMQVAENAVMSCKAVLIVCNEHCPISSEVRTYECTAYISIRVSSLDVYVCARVCVGCTNRP
jgi:hypothetical protein